MTEKGSATSIEKRLHVQDRRARKQVAQRLGREMPRDVMQ